MSHLQFPIRDRLREPADEAALARVWRGIDARHPRRRGRPRAIYLAGGLVLAGAAAAVLPFLRGRDAGPLKLIDGRALASIEAPAGGTSLSLSDGSRIGLGAGARLEPVASSGSEFVAILERGTADFEVRPGGPRRWRIACGLATVEVVGTRFSCERSPSALRVAVQHGVVLVSGERVPDRVRRLVAGERLTVDATASPAPGAAPAVPALQEGTPGGAVPPVPPSEGNFGAPTVAPRAPRSRPASASDAPWRELAHAGRHEDAYAALGSKGIGRETQRLGVADLLVLADVARLSGHPAEAEAPLERILADHPDHPQAPLAAFALGRLELDALDRPARAAAAFARALALGVPRSLKEDLRARLVEAYVRAGNRAAARSAAREYEREFPGGRYARSIESGESRVLPRP